MSAQKSGSSLPVFVSFFSSYLNQKCLLLLPKYAVAASFPLSYNAWKMFVSEQAVAGAASATHPEIPVKLIINTLSVLLKLIVTNIGLLCMILEQ